MPAVLLFYLNCSTFGGNESLLFSIIKQLHNRNNLNIILVCRVPKSLKLDLHPDLKSSPNLEILFIDHMIFRISENKNINNLSRIANKIIEMTGILFFSSLIQFAKLLNKKKPNIIHIFNGGYPGALTSEYLALLAGLVYKIKTIMHINNTPRRRFLPTAFLFDWAVEWAIQYCVFSSNTNAKLMLKKRGFENKKIRILRNFVIDHNQNWIRISNRTRFTNGDKTIRLLSVGSLVKRKGHIFLIEALSKVLKQNRKIEVILVGDGESKVYLMAKIKEYGLEKQIALVGHQDNLLEYYRNSDIFIMPSLYGEDLPLSLLQAMAASLPVIVTDVGGMREVIEISYNGIVVEPGNHNELAQAILFYLKNPTMLFKHGSNSRNGYKMFYSDSIYIDQLNNFYKEIL